LTPRTCLSLKLDRRRFLEVSAETLPFSCPLEATRSGKWRQSPARLVSEPAIRLMMENQIGDLVVERQSAVNSSVVMAFPPGAGNDKFGFGFQIETPPSEAGMRSPGSVSWGGIFNTNFWIDPQRGIAAVALMQTLPYADSKCFELLRGFERLVYQELR
jgi:methyl acetate hydrolase